MSQHLINEYRAELDRLRAVSGSRRESVLREAFKDLLKRWGKAHDLQFIAEHDIVTKAMTRIYLDGALLHGLRVPFGYWEAKDENDDLAKEIEAKFRKGYPRDNIIFTDDATAVLWQDGSEVKRASGTAHRPVLNSLPEQGVVRLDEDTQLSGIPVAAWRYRLGNRSAIDWVLDQHKEETPRDPTIREKFNTYRFPDYKESMISLLAKVACVSVDTVAITDAMAAIDRSGWEEAKGGGDGA